MALYVVLHKQFGEKVSDPYYGKESTETRHTYVCCEESEVKKLVDDLNTNSSSTRFPRTEEQEDAILSKISSLRSQIETQNLSEDEKSRLDDEIYWLYYDLNDDDYDYWDYKLICFKDIDKARSFLL